MSIHLNIKIKRATGVVIAAMAAASLATGCKKAVYDCDYRINCFVQDTSGAKDRPLESGLAFAFYGDTAQYEVASYEDALEGIVTDRRSGEKRSSEVSTTTDETGLAVLHLTSTPVILTVCDPETRLYAWRAAEVGASLDAIYVSLRFRPWREAKRYTEAKWLMVNQFYSPAPPKEEEGAAQEGNKE